MNVKEKLDHMARMYDAYGYGGVMVGGKRKTKAKPKAKRPLSPYNKFFAKMRKKGYDASQIGQMWRNR